GPPVPSRCRSAWGGAVPAPQDVEVLGGPGEAHRLAVVPDQLDERLAPLRHGADLGDLLPAVGAPSQLLVVDTDDVDDDSGAQLVERLEGESAHEDDPDHGEDAVTCGDDVAGTQVQHDEGGVRDGQDGGEHPEPPATHEPG